MSFGNNGFRDIAAPALRSASISAASLIIRSRRSTSVASTGTTPKTSASGSRCNAGIESVTAVVAGAPPRASATIRYGSSPSTQSRTASPSSVTADSLSEANSSRGTTTVASPAAESTSAVSLSKVCAREPTR
jgi:hypothetical protein